MPDPKKGKILSTKTIDLITNFYEDSDYSRQMPGQKDLVSIKRNVHKQKRLVLLTLKELHASFKSKYPEITVGFSKFCDL